MEVFDFGQTLRAYRLARRWNQDELARRADMSRQGISNLENSKSAPRMSTVERLAVALNVPVTSLVEVERGVLPGPPVFISPWPPRGITWEEVQLAISDFVGRRTRQQLDELNKEAAKEGRELVIGPSMPIFDDEAEDEKK